MRRLILSLALLASACNGKDSPTAPTPPPTQTPTPTPPAQQMIAMDGTVSETSPTAATRVPNPTLRIADGPSAGTTTTGGGDGYFFFGSIATGTFRVEVSAPNYESNTFTVTRTASGSMPFNLRPVLRTIDSTYADAISGGTERCQTRLGQQPCKIFRFGVHHDGNVEAVLNWGSSNNDIDLDLWQDTTRLANSDNVSGTEERITSAVRAGLSYEFRIYYWRGNTIDNFTLRVRRPS